MEEKKSSKRSDKEAGFRSLGSASGAKRTAANSKRTEVPKLNLAVSKADQVVSLLQQQVEKPSNLFEQSITVPVKTKSYLYSQENDYVDVPYEGIQGGRRDKTDGTYVHRLE